MEAQPLHAVNAKTAVDIGSKWLQPNTFSQTSHRALVCYCLVASLSIGLSQVVIVPLILYWLVFSFVQRKRNAVHSRYGKDDERVADEDEQPELQRQIFLFAVPLVFWILCSFFSMAVGVDPLRALPECLKTTFHLLLPFCVYTSLTCAAIRESLLVHRVRIYFIALVLSQAVASLHTFVSIAVNHEILPRPPGPVTESGQLVLVLCCIFALILLSSPRKPLRSVVRKNMGSLLFSERVLPIVVFLCLLVCVWPQILGPVDARFSPFVFQACAALVVVLLYLPTVFAIFRKWLKRPMLFRRTNTQEFRLFTVFMLAILLAALVINLKRGPWLGVFFELLLIGVLLSRKFLLSTLLVALLFLCTLQPVQDRIFHLTQDFVVSGGRQNMWALGLELAGSYPLGLGPDNASYMHQLDPTLPKIHRHMHNNLLNVAVETGWLGLMAYCWWLIAAIGIGIAGWRHLRSATKRLSQERGMLALMLSFALIGWQVAGLVEYNFGDGEVSMIAFFFMGLILALVSFQQPPSTSPDT